MIPQGKPVADVAHGDIVLYKNGPSDPYGSLMLVTEVCECEVRGVLLTRDSTGVSEKDAVCAIDDPRLGHPSFLTNLESDSSRGVFVPLPGGSAEMRRRIEEMSSAIDSLKMQLAEMDVGELVEAGPRRRK